MEIQGINEFGKYCLPEASIHRPAAQKILSGGIHEPNTIGFIIKNSSGGDIIHAGAYFGDFLPALSSICGDGFKVWAFEPNPENFVCAERTAKINDLQKVNLLNLGLGSTRDKAKMMVRDRYGIPLGGGSRIIEWGTIINQGGFLQIQVDRLDNVIPNGRRVSVIHLDIEGYEKFALEGAERILQKYHPLLILESDPGVEWMEEMGYQKRGMVDQNVIYSFDI